MLAPRTDVFQTEPKIAVVFPVLWIVAKLADTSLENLGPVNVEHGGEGVLLSPRNISRRARALDPAMTA